MDKRRSAPPNTPARAARDRRMLSGELVDRVHSTTLEEGSARLHRRDEAAATSARREISNNLREDWTWPPNPSQSANPIRITASTQWRERDSDSGSSSPSPPPGSPVLPSNPYRYDSPDSILHLAIPRKRRRRRQLQQEMSWNEGLATYTRRRDAWAGARVSSPETLLDSSVHHNGSAGPPKHGFLSTSNPPLQEIDYDLPPLLPLPPPLLPLSNPIRASITSDYPSIYNKVVVRGLTPIVPINLSDMVGALVQGWKDDGEWPPQSGMAEAELEARSGVMAFVVGTKNGTALAKRGVGKMKKALGLGEDGGGHEV